MPYRGPLVNGIQWNPEILSVHVAVLRDGLDYDGVVLDYDGGGGVVDYDASVLDSRGVVDYDASVLDSPGGL